MDRGTWAIGCLAIAAAGCGLEDYADLFGPVPSPGPVTGASASSSSSGTGVSTTSSSASSSSTSSSTGEGGAGGGATASASSTASSSASGTGGSACVPHACPADACGPTSDGCETSIDCGVCPGNQMCTAGSCCTPNPHACDGVCNSTVLNGCGGTVKCDGVCGGDEQCSPSNVCTCEDAAMQPGAILAWTNCNSGGGTQYHPYYCGENSDDIPKGCSSPGIAIPPSNKLLYCCQ